MTNDIPGTSDTEIQNAVLALKEFTIWGVQISNSKYPGRWEQGLWSHTDMTGFQSLSDLSITSYVSLGENFLVNEMWITL